VPLQEGELRRIAETGGPLRAALAVKDSDISDREGNLMAFGIMAQLMSDHG